MICHRIYQINYSCTSQTNCVGQICEQPAQRILLFDFGWPRPACASKYLYLSVSLIYNDGWIRLNGFKRFLLACVAIFIISENFLHESEIHSFGISHTYLKRIRRKELQIRHFATVKQLVIILLLQRISIARQFYAEYPIISMRKRKLHQRKVKNTWWEPGKWIELYELHNNELNLHRLSQRGTKINI